MCTHTFSLPMCERTHVVQSKQANVPAPRSGECPTLCANASLWLWINNSECWHSRVEPLLLFMVGIGTDRWLVLILRTRRHTAPPRNHAIFNTFMSVSILHPLSSPPLPSTQHSTSASSFSMPLLSWSLSSPSVSTPPCIHSVSR